MATTHYHLHSGARRVLVAGGILCCLLVLMAPVGLVVFVYVLRARVTISEEGMTVRGLGTKSLRLNDVARLGLYEAPLPDGIAGLFTQIKLGGETGYNICWLDHGGRTRTVCVSVYERQAEILRRVSEMVGEPYEQLTMGLTGVKWP